MAQCGILISLAKAGIALGDRQRTLCRHQHVGMGVANLFCRAFTTFCSGDYRWALWRKKKKRGGEEKKKAKEYFGFSPRSRFLCS